MSFSITLVIYVTLHLVDIVLSSMEELELAKALERILKRCVELIGNIDYAKVTTRKGELPVEKKVHVDGELAENKSNEDDESDGERGNYPSQRPKFVQEPPK